MNHYKSSEGRKVPMPVAPYAMAHAGNLFSNALSALSIAAALSMPTATHPIVQGGLESTLDMVVNATAAYRAMVVAA